MANVKVFVHATYAYADADGDMDAKAIISAPQTFVPARWKVKR